MFTLDPTFTHLSVSSDRVLCLWQSINALTVKVPGMPMEPATAAVVGFSVGPGKASLIVYLYQDAARARVAYAREPKVFAPAELDAAVDEARDFLESMGFMLDDSAFASRSSEEKLALVAHAPVFHADLVGYQKGRHEAGADVIPDAEIEAVAEPEAAPGPRAQLLGRLLVSF